MASFFTDPYPGELFYSAISRYHRRAGYKSKIYTALDLLGCSSAGSTIDLPTRLGHFVAALPKGHVYTVENVINKLTLLPFYEAFLPAERGKQIREAMESGVTGKIHNWSAITSHALRITNLRYCVLCVVADRKELRETYWHRVHQIPGVQICVEHNTFLESSNVSVINRRERKEFRAAETHVPKTGELPSPRFILEGDQNHEILRYIAHSAAWLLSHPQLSLDSETARGRYLSLLCDQGLANYTGKVAGKGLQKAFETFYSLALLADLKCELKPYWVPRLYGSYEPSQPPIRHLLLMHLLGVSPESFFFMQQLQPPFGQGPWPCLNHAAKHYGELTVNKCSIRYAKKEPRLPVGKFICDCGFTYSRTGIDRSPDDQMRYDRIYAYGETWYSELRRLYADKSLDLQGIAEKLGISRRMIERRLLHLGIWKTSGNERSLKRKDAQADKEKKLIACRQVWLTAVAENPNANRTEIRRIAASVHTWLRVNDRTWLEENSPAPQQNVNSKSFVNWVERDKDLAEKIRFEAARIKASNKFPVKISRDLLYNLLCITKRVSTYHGFLPLTLTALDEVCES